MADRTDASPTGDPHIAQSESAEMDARRAARAANLFDVRRLIGALFIVYGLILLVLGFLESDASIEKSAGVNVNLWSGLGMLVFGVLFMAWALLRPLSGEIDEAGKDDRSVKGASPPVGADAAALGGSKTTRRRPRGDGSRAAGERPPGGQ